MTNSFTNRPLVAGVLAFTATTALTSVAALAACGGAPTLVALSGLVGPPSISATEASTDQALELIRKRREEASGSCPSGFVRSGGNCVPANAAQASFPGQAVAQAPAAPAPAVSVSTTTTVGPASAPPAAAPAPAGAASRPAAKQRVARVNTGTGTPAATAPSSPGYQAGYAGGSLKDGSYDVAMPGTLRARGTWLEAYYDYEKHKNLNPGQQANPSRRTVSGGVIAGVDISEFSTNGVGVKGYQLGFFGGHNSTRAKFSNTFDPVEGTNDAIGTLANRQEVHGGFFGFYGSLVRGAVSADLTVKMDLFSVEQSFIERNFNECAGGVTITDIQRFNETNVTNYTAASNLNYRIPMGGTYYIEPTVGARYTHSDFGGNAFALGLRDGDVFRLQGGLRLGTQTVTPDGWVWQTSLTGLLYSDVSMSGLVVTGPQGPGLSAVSSPVDEGKLRAMGILESRVNVGSGYTLYGDVEVRGGQDLFGYGGRVGVRYQW